MGLVPKPEASVGQSKAAGIRESLMSDFQNTKLVYFGGTIESKDTLRLKRMLFRSTRGKAIMTTFPLEVEETDRIRNDSFHNENEGYYVLIEDTGCLVDVVKRVCKSFSMRDDIQKVFLIEPQNIKAEILTITDEKHRMKDLITTTKQNLYNYMCDYQKDGYSLISVYKQFVGREKIIYRALNTFKHCGDFSVGLAWAPTYRLEEFLSHI